MKHTFFEQYLMLGLNISYYRKLRGHTPVSYTHLHIVFLLLPSSVGLKLIGVHQCVNQITS